MKGWLKNMLFSSNPAVRKRGGLIADRQRAEYEADWQRLYQSPSYTGKKPVAPSRVRVHAQSKPVNQKPKGWRPGMYEGKTIAEVQAEVGKAVKSPKGERTPDSFNWRAIAGHHDRGVNVHY